MSTSTSSVVVIAYANLSSLNIPYFLKTTAATATKTATKNHFVHIPKEVLDELNWVFTLSPAEKNRYVECIIKGKPPFQQKSEGEVPPKSIILELMKQNRVRVEIFHFIGLELTVPDDLCVQLYEELNSQEDMSVILAGIFYHHRTLLNTQTHVPWNALRRPKLGFRIWGYSNQQKLSVIDHHTCYSYFPVFGPFKKERYELIAKICEKTTSYLQNSAWDICDEERIWVRYITPQSGLDISTIKKKTQLLLWWNWTKKGDMIYPPFAGFLLCSFSSDKDIHCRIEDFCKRIFEQCLVPLTDVDVLDFSGGGLTPRWKRNQKESELQKKMKMMNLEESNQVRMVNLSDNYLTWDDVSFELPILLETFVEIEMLDLSYNSIGGKDFIAFLESAEKKYPKVKINITGNPKEKYLEPFLLQKKKMNSSNILYYDS
jgi:hypothetical protein